MKKIIYKEAARSQLEGFSVFRAALGDSIPLYNLPNV